MQREILGVLVTNSDCLVWFVVLRYVALRVE